MSKLIRNTGKGTIQPDSILVAGGFVILNFVTQTTQLQDVNEIKLHPEFNWVTLQNDVAVLKARFHYVISRSLCKNSRIYNIIHNSYFTVKTIV